MNIWTPKLIKPQPNIAIKGLVVAVLTDPQGKVLSRKEVHNIVTNDGDLFYAQLADAFFNASEPTNFTDGGGNFDAIMELYDNTGNAPAKTSNRSDAGVQIGSGKAMDAGYPKINDDDADNTGAGTDIITYRVSFTTGEVNGSIDEVILTNPAPGASEPVITFADGLNTTKTSSNGLKVFINHEMLGV